MGKLGERKKHRNDNIISIHIDDQNCWVCGQETESKHHGIPKELKPIHNVFIPVCRKCHDNIHGIEKRDSQSKA